MGSPETLSPRQTARRIRYAIVLALRDAGRPMSVAELCVVLAAAGAPLGAAPNKLVADALRWEVRNDRVRKVRRGSYAYRGMPASTQRWMRSESARIRRDLGTPTDEFAGRLHTEPDRSERWWDPDKTALQLIERL